MIKPFSSYLKSTYFLIRQIYLRIRELLFAHPLQNPKEVPIIINNFNRLTFLKVLVYALEERGYNNIYIIDNASTYPPLLEYYNGIPYKIFRLRNNVGFLSLWETGIYKQFKNQYFVYTDSDVVPVDECPDDFIAYFYSLMQRYPRASKIGFSLKIDDIPDCFINKEKVLNWEQQFWKKPIDENLYQAPIDTTFALYRPNVKGKAYFHDFSIRTAGKYMARHLPWYDDSNKQSEEERYYIEHARTSTHWTAIVK